MKKHIMFDFDGVLVESNDIRVDGFRKLLASYPETEMKEFLDWAIPNGGISRYDKIRYFFNVIRLEEITDEEVNLLARGYSNLVKQSVIDARPVEGAVEFLSKYYTVAEFSLFSASDGDELRDICRARKIDFYFRSVLGSPKNKKDNLRDYISENSLDKKDCVYIGDSINDFEAAGELGIDFIGRNSGLEDWGSRGVVNFDDFSQKEFIEYFESLIKIK